MLYYIFMMNPIAIVLFLIFVNVDCAPTNSYNSTTHTIINTRQVEPQGTIESKVLKEPHNLYIGRCESDDNILHQENIILYNDGKSHVENAKIRVTVQAEVHITCVNIYDEIPNGEGGIPHFVAGGKGYNFVEFNVTTGYGKGFHFFVQILGYQKNKNENNVEQEKI